MGKELFVPVRMEAFMAGKHTAPVADMEYNFEQMEVLPVGSSICNSLFTKRGILPGIHLHWIMPDALLQGEEKEGEVIFPPLPDRFVLHRLWQEEGQVKRRSFLVKSNFCSNTANKTCQGINKQTIPVLKKQDGIWEGGGKNGEKYGFLGSVIDLDSPVSEDGFLLDEITAVGMGDPLFSAFYERSKTVFGFYDSCEDIERGTLTYCLCGYYDRKEQDPLQDTKWAGQFQNWEGYDFPCRMILHGCIRTLEWEGADAVYDSAVPQGNLDIYIGNNSKEAMAAYMGENLAGSPESERLLHAMMGGALESMDSGSPDGLLELEENLHEQQFGVVEAGSVWSIRSIMDTSDYLSKKREKVCETELLQKLNSRQLEYQKQFQENEDMKKKGYGLWCRYLYQFTPSPFDGPRREITLTAAEDLLTGIEEKEATLTAAEDLLAEIEEKEAEVNRLAAEVSAIKEDLERRLEGSGYKLAEEKQRFYEPLAPALLIPGAGRKKRQGFQTDAEGKLLCRQRTVSSLRAGQDEEAVEITGEDLMAWRCPDYIPAAKEAEAVLYETLLVSQDFHPALARAYGSRLGKEYDEEEKEKLEEQIEGWKGEEDRWNGILPAAPACTVYQPPWYPILMQWRAALTPLAGNEMEERSILNCYELAELDYVTKKETAPAAVKPIEYIGSTLLTPQAPLQAKHQLKRLLEGSNTYRSSKALQRLADQMEEYDILSQRMDGMMEKRLLQEKTVAVPVCRFRQTPDELLRRMGRFFKQQDTIPAKYGRMEEFQPIQEGVLELKELWIVDSFGQVKEVKADAEHIHISEVLAMKEKGKALLRPRLPKPCRLECEWLLREGRRQSAEGYLLPDFPDKTLRFYDGGGLYLGTLAASAREVVWTREEAAVRKSGENPHMDGLRESLLGLPVPKFLEFLNQLEEGCRCRMPLDGEVISKLCFGRILAVARIRMQVKEMGLRAMAQTAEAEGSKGYEEVGFPIQIGDDRKVREGIFGFFAGSDPKTMYGSGGLLFQECGGQVNLSLKGGPVEMTLLFDPLGRGHLTSGFLPRTVLSLDYSCYQEQIGKMESHLNTAPVLVHEGMLDLPAPGGESQRENWEFLWKDSCGGWKAEKLKAAQVLLQENNLQIKEGYLKWRS